MAFRNPKMHLPKLIAVLLLSIVLGFSQDRTNALPDSGPGATRQNVLYVGRHGDDTTALVSRLDKPYLTLGAARAHSEDSLVYVYPGRYTNNTSLATNAINYFMLPGVTVDYVGKQLTNIIDDTLHAGGINVSVDGFADFANHSTYYDSLNYSALVLITNPLSRLDIRCRDMLLNKSDTGAIDIRNCTYVNIDAQNMVGGIDCGGVYWRDGSGIHIKAKEIRTGAYALWEDSSGTNTVQDMFADIDYIQTGGEGGIYVSGKNPNSALWVRSKVMKFESVTGVHHTGTSKLYTSAQKYWITGTNGALFYLGHSGRFWGDGNKATSAGAPFLLTTDGFVDLTIQQYEESGGIVGVGFDLTGGTVSVHGGRMDIRGTCVKNISGTNNLSDIRLDSSRGTQSPVIVAGPGLTLQNCTVVAAEGVESITATNAQTVTILGTLSVNTTPSKNITFVGGRLVIDNSVSSTGPAPTIVAGLGAGSSPKVSVVGDDVAGEITITTGTLPQGGAIIATVAYQSSPFVRDSYPMISPANGAASDLPYLPFVDGTTTNFSLNARGNGLRAGTTYKYNYHVIGR